jgi:hypothetical protein
VQSGWIRLFATLSDPDLQSVVCFCAIGFLSMLNAILWFPDFGETVAELVVFP